MISTQFPFVGRRSVGWVFGTVAWDCGKADNVMIMLLEVHSVDEVLGRTHNTSNIHVVVGSRNTG